MFLFVRLLFPLFSHVVSSPLANLLLASCTDLQSWLQIATARASCLLQCFLSAFFFFFYFFGMLRCWLAVGLSCLFACCLLFAVFLPLLWWRLTLRRRHANGFRLGGHAACRISICISPLLWRAKSDSRPRSSCQLDFRQLPPSVAVLRCSECCCHCTWTTPPPQAESQASNK